MGNATSCAPSIISNGATKVVSPNGKTELYTRHVKAAELMLDNAGKFVCDAGTLKVGHRIQALSADDDLEKRRLYLLLPMDLLYSVLTLEEFTSFTTNTNNTKSFFPSLGEFCLFLPNNNVRSDSDSDSDSNSSESRGDTTRVERSYSKQRSWRPALETIVESPSCRSH